MHSLHAYFLRRGDFNAPIVYEVDRARDGNHFSTRRVVAIQHGEQIFNMSASFQLPEHGLEHQAAMPAVPAARDSLADASVYFRQRSRRLLPEGCAACSTSGGRSNSGPCSRRISCSGRCRRRAAIWFRAVGAAAR